MNDMSRSRDVPDWRDVPDMTPEQKERIDRRVHAAIAAQNRRFAWERRAKRALPWGLVAACCGAALALAHHEVAPHQGRSVLPAVVDAVELDTQPFRDGVASDPAPPAEPLPPPSVSSTGDTADPRIVAPRRRRHHRHP